MVGVPSHEQVISPYWGGASVGLFFKTPYYADSFKNSTEKHE